MSRATFVFQLGIGQAQSPSNDPTVADCDLDRCRLGGLGAVVNQLADRLTRIIEQRDGPRGKATSAAPSLLWPLATDDLAKCYGLLRELAGSPPDWKTICYRASEAESVRVQAIADLLATLCEAETGLDPLHITISTPGRLEMRTVEKLRAVATILAENAEPIAAASKQGTHGKKRKVGRPPLAKSSPIQLQIYTRIRKEHQANRKETLERLKLDKDFCQQVQEAKLKLGEELIKNALSHATRPRRTDR